MFQILAAFLLGGISTAIALLLFNIRFPVVHLPAMFSGTLPGVEAFLAVTTAVAVLLMIGLA